MHKAWHLGICNKMQKFSDWLELSPSKLVQFIKMTSLTRSAHIERSNDAKCGIKKVVMY